MDCIGCIVPIPGALEDLKSGGQFLYMRRIGHMERVQTYSLTYLIGLIDTNHLGYAPDNVPSDPQNQRKWKNLKAFLQYSQQSLLNHHNFRHFREIPGLLQKVADEIATPSFLSALEAVNPEARIDVILSNCWENGFTAVYREDQVFTLYPTYAKPLWAPLCCGCPSTQSFNSVTKIPSALCTHHSKVEKDTCVLYLNPRPCELRIETRVLTSPALEKCHKCKAVGLIWEVSSFCVTGCKLCFGCAMEIYYFPCFPCPNCALPCKYSKLREMSESMATELEQITALSLRMSTQLDSFPTCRVCGETYYRHMLAIYGSTHNTCNLCEDCFTVCNSTDSLCTICKDRFSDREKALLNAKKKLGKYGCWFCFSEHECYAPEFCALCDYRRALSDRFGLSHCSVCKTDLREMTTECEITCDKCQLQYPLMYFQYRNFCKMHVICLNCAHNELAAKNGSSSCPVCNQSPPEPLLLCESCFQAPVSMSVHRTESDKCRLCWDCVCSEKGVYCSRCSGFLSDICIDYQLHKENSFCESCWALRYPLYQCRDCRTNSCFYCLYASEQGVVCPNCAHIASDASEFSDRVKNFQTRCSLCYDGKEPTIRLPCGHNFHAYCIKSVPRCPLCR